MTNSDEEDEVPWSLQEGIDGDSWPAAARAAAAGLRQGSLVKSPPFVYAANAAHPIHDTSKAWSASSKADTGVVNVLQEKQRPPFGLIVTQTCDLVEEGRPKRPWVLIAPVYILSASPGDCRRIAQGRGFDYLVAISALDAPDVGIWVADLRLMMAVEKGWLVEQTAIDGFVAEEEFRSLAARLARRFARPAYAQSVVDHVLKPSYQLWGEILEKYGGSDPIVDVGMRLGRSPLDPVNVELVFLLDADISADLRAQIVDWWQPLAEGARGAGLEFLAPRFARLDELTAREYRGLDILDAAALSPADEEPP